MNTPTQLGRYTVRGELGRGAMGVVYEGFDPSIERTVAIKVLQLDKLAEAMGAEMRTRFRREAQAAGRLTHPHIVGVYEYNDGDAAASGHSGFPYIVMERVVGRTLKSMFDELVHFSLDDTVRLMSQLLAALQHAHERGVVHRDIKPSNLMVLAPEPLLSIKVTDFGIARLDSSDLTQTGATLGTATHMSPEQFLGQAVDGRTDLYAAGVILYQFLTGELPFTGSPSTVMQKVLNQEALAPSLLNPTLPSVWDAVVRRAMAKKPSDRFASAADFEAAMRTASLRVDPDATVVRPVQTLANRAKSSRALVGGVTAVCVAVSALGVYVATRQPAPPLIAGAASVPTPPTLPIPVEPKPAVLKTAAKPTTEPVPSPTVAATGAASASASAAPTRAAAPSRQACRDGAGVHPACPQVLGLFYLEAKDFTQALKWLRVGADKADARAQLELGMMYFRAQGVARDSKAGFAWAKQAADQGLGSAENIVGVCFERGDGTPQSISNALVWYRKSAEHGNSFGQNNLARMLLQGRGVPKDPKQALELLRRAAAQRNAYAASYLGHIYEKGEFVTADKQAAAKWFRLALEHGLETTVARDPWRDKKTVDHAKAFIAANP
jgi:Protein kinase domain/Sel1 repeat